nr:MAG TPA: hypothetical protein [Caudoviricetes sp.]
MIKMLMPCGVLAFLFGKNICKNVGKHLQWRQAMLS